MQWYFQRNEPNKQHSKHWHSKLLYSHNGILEWQMLGKGQKTAANLVLLGTILSLLTLPLMALIMNAVPDIYAG